MPFPTAPQLEPPSTITGPPLSVTIAAAVLAVVVSILAWVVLSKRPITAATSSLQGPQQEQSITAEPAADTTTTPVLRIAFLHPDLGLGGAERLIVDAAAELAQRGHHVHIYTAYYDPQRCFQETKSGAFGVSVAGDWFPRSLGGRALALCAYVRCVLLSLHIAWQSLGNWFNDLVSSGGGGGRSSMTVQGRRTSTGSGTGSSGGGYSSKGGGGYDVIIVDQVSVAIPVLQALLPAPVLFYCHFPDLLLAKKGSLLKSLYRRPLDYLEQASTGISDLVLVNSEYTRGIFADTFTRLHEQGMRPEVLYPAVSVPTTAALLEAQQPAAQQELPPELLSFIQAAGKAPVFLSINRFERKKGIDLALRALHQLLQTADASLSTIPEVDLNPNPSGKSATPAIVGAARLIVAGGYDVRVAENVEHLAELQALTQELGLTESVYFLPSFTDRQRALLLAACTAVLYTPQNEHFGIVPLEAMAAARPVIACNSGGPRESVLHGQSGMLCEPTAESWAGAMRALSAAGVASELGSGARAHVQARFSRGAFGAKLDVLVTELAAGRIGRRRRVMQLHGTVS